MQQGVNDSTRQMIFSTVHWKKLIVGYSGISPVKKELFIRDLHAQFPSDETIDSLLELSVRFVIIRENLLSTEQRSAIESQERLVAEKRLPQMVIYKLE
jgi:hypothetical protein